MVADTSAPRNKQVAQACAEAERLAEFIRSIGGPSHVAMSLGISSAAVCQWYTRLRGVVPPAHHAALWRLAQAKGVQWTPPGFEGVRLLPVDPGHCGDGSVNTAPSDRECSVNLGDAA